MTRGPGDARSRGWPGPRGFLVLLLVLGAATRLYGLEIQSLWFDELFSWRLASLDSVATMIGEIRTTDVHPPGHAVVLHAFVKVFGDAEWVLRLPSALAGILAIGAVYQLGRRLYSSREGLVGAGLIAFSWAPQYYSQEARAYSLLLLFTIVTAGLWWELVHRLRRGRSPCVGLALLYAVAAMVTCYLHYFGLLMVGLLGVAGVFVIRGRSLGSYVGLHGIVLIALSLWIPVMLAQGGREHFWIERPVPEDLWDWWRHAFSRSGLLSLVALGLFTVWGVRWFLRRPRQVSAPTLFLIAWLGIVLLGTYWISLVFRPILTERNLIVCLPPAFLLVARAMHQMPWNPRWIAGLAIVFVVGSAVQVFGLLDYYGKPRKHQYREMTQRVLAGPNEGTSLILATDCREGYDYYFRKQGSGRRVAALARGREDLKPIRRRLRRSRGQDPAAEAGRRTESYDHVWLMQGLTEVDPAIVEFLSSQFARTERTDLRRATVWWFTGDVEEP